MQDKKIKISSVAYLNSIPFIYGIKNSQIFNNEVELELDIPSTCAKKLLSDKVDIGLVPVAVFPKLSYYQIISDYCIGAEGKVETVLLVSDVPLCKIDNILLDYQSKTSVNLTKLLARTYWKINPGWINATEGYEERIKRNNAGVIIGDRTFNLRKKYNFQYDLAEEWMKFTGKPFVFATWTANKPLPADFVSNFNKAIKFGVEHIDEAIERYRKKHPFTTINIEQYLHEKISYNLDQKKREAMRLFLSYIKENIRVI